MVTKRTKRTPFATVPETRRAILYARYSSDMQDDSWSIDAQLNDLRRYCERQDWQIVAEHLDPAKSGKDADRPGFQACMADVRSNKGNVIVVHKIDRFSRNMIDTFNYMGELDKRGAGLVCTQQGIDTTNPYSGKVIVAVLAALAEAFLDNLSEETSKGKRARAEGGLQNGDLRYGYRNPDEGTDKSGAGVNNRTVPVIDEAEALAVRRAFELYITGQYSDNRVAQTLNAAGYRMVSKRHPNGYPFTKDTVTAMLQAPFYMGKVTLYGETLGDGQHELIISPNVFEIAQQVRRRRGRTNGIYLRQKYHYLMCNSLRAQVASKPSRSSGARPN
jgi:site-specific DNA recombinase